MLCCLLGGGVKVFNESTIDEVLVRGSKKKHFCSMAGKIDVAVMGDLLAVIKGRFLSIRYI